ncbi:hypothetical protein [Demequina subtropica]|uniref:hypothetical protein n=1 Tax=Demequina subtropica TaxID=1638989 RepID=UPI0007834499|nr:hypothetical protein [Demequina subtropica]
MTGSTSDSLHDLRALAGALLEDDALVARQVAVAARVERHRRVRAVVAGATGLAVVGVLAVGAILWPSPETLAPAPAGTPAPSASTSADAATDVCDELVEISGKPIGNIGGIEHEWNGMPDAPCEDWPARVLAHPNTVVINTSDGTMLQLDYRIESDDIDAYRDLGPDFLVPFPDPSWPVDKLITIDTATGVIVDVMAIPEGAETFGLDADVPSSPSDQVEAVLDAFAHPAGLTPLAGGWTLLDGGVTTAGAYAPALVYLTTETYVTWTTDPETTPESYYSATLWPERKMPDEHGDGSAVQCAVGDAFLVVVRHPEGDADAAAMQEALVEALRGVTGLTLDGC